LKFLKPYSLRFPEAKFVSSIIRKVFGET